jgi:exodeoxyribonuclease I
MTLKRFLWHDYETFGADPARDRPAQFAGLYTDAELQPVGEPLMFYCRPVMDVLPHPDAVAITGITPQIAEREGLDEPAFAQRVFEAFSRPGTCGVGYNSLRFDDEVTRNLLYRNFHDPYLREWSGGNSRWDLIDVVRLWHALRPEGLTWPQGEHGATSFKLEHLSAANGLQHERAHDALSDVHATLALARRLKAAQPRLFAHALTLRDKKVAAALLTGSTQAPVLHVSSRIPAALGCITAVVAVAPHPRNRNCVLCFDLRQDPEALLSAPIDELHDRLFTPREDLPEGVERLALKGIHLNKSPMLAPMSTLQPAQAQRWQLDLEQLREHHELLMRAGPALVEKVQALYADEDRSADDPEVALYSGFIPDADRARCAQVRADGPGGAAPHDGRFEDPRLNELLFRWRARHAPHTLTPGEQDAWRAFVERKLSIDTGLASLTLPAYQQLVEARLQQDRDPDRLRQWLDLRNWPRDSGLLDWMPASPG